MHVVVRLVTSLCLFLCSRKESLAISAMPYQWTLCFLTVTLAVLHATHARQIDFKSCNAANNVISVDLSPCDNLPCQFKKGTVVTVTIDFNTSATVQNLTALVYGIVAGVPIPFALPKPDACHECNLTCPIIPGEHVYRNNFNVLPSYPEIRLAIEWKMVDENRNPVVCVAFPLAIVD